MTHGLAQRWDSKSESEMDCWHVSSAALSYIGRDQLRFTYNSLQQPFLCIEIRNGAGNLNLPNGRASGINLSFPVGYESSGSKNTDGWIANELILGILLVPCIGVQVLLDLANCQVGAGAWFS